MVKNILGSSALLKRVAGRLDKAVNEKIVQAVNQVRRTKWGKRLIKNILAIRALKKSIENRLERTVDKGIDKVVKLAQNTRVGRVVMKNVMDSNSLKHHVENRLQKILNAVEKRGIKATKRTVVSSRLVKNVSGLRNLLRRIKDRVTDKLANGIEQGVDVMRQTGRLAAHKLLGKENPLTQMLPDYKEPKMCYSMDPKEVKRVIDAVLAGEPYNKDQLLYYHLNRNYFNVKNTVTKLTKIGPHKYRDNLGKKWTELYRVQNRFHMPDESYANSFFSSETPYSRKFVRNDDISGVGGEFELVIKENGKRIDGKTNTAWQEYYNFGRTNSHLINHIELDMNTHSENSNYVSYGEMGSVDIID